MASGSLKYYPFADILIGLQRSGKNGIAGKTLNQALKLDPMNADYLAELGHIYIKLGVKLRAKCQLFKKR